VVVGEAGVALIPKQSSYLVSLATSNRHMMVANESCAGTTSVGGVRARVGVNNVIIYECCWCHFGPCDGCVEWKSLSLSLSWRRS
jgi:hypothetical protein